MLRMFVAPSGSLIERGRVVGLVRTPAFDAGGRVTECHRSRQIRILSGAVGPAGWLHHSARRACITLTRAARAAGNTDATTATAIKTNAETTTGKVPGILISTKNLPASRVSMNPVAAPARIPAPAIIAPSAMTPVNSWRG